MNTKPFHISHELERYGFNVLVSSRYNDKLTNIPLSHHIVNSSNTTLEDFFNKAANYKGQCYKAREIIPMYTYDGLINNYNEYRIIL